jgi:hypothetical protein
MSLELTGVSNSIYFSMPTVCDYFYLAARSEGSCCESERLEGKTLYLKND